jgi:hypothetical protein
MSSSKKISKIAIAKRQLHQHELIAMRLKRDLVGRMWNKIMKFLDFFSFLNNQPMTLCAYKIFPRRWRQQPVISRIILHMHDQFEMIPKGTKKICLNFTATSFNNCTWTRERKSLPTSRTHNSWWHKDGSNKFPTLLPNVQYRSLQTWRK